MKITTFGLPEELSCESAKALGVQCYVYLSALSAASQSYWALYTAVRDGGAQAIADFRAALPQSDGFDRLLYEARDVDAPPLPLDWPAHLTADGTERARALLQPFNVTVDFLK